MEALLKYNPQEAHRFTQKRLDAALSAMNTLKSEIQNLKDALKAEHQQVAAWKKKYKGLEGRYNKLLAGQKSTNRYRLPQIRRAVCTYFSIPGIPQVGGTRRTAVIYPRQLYIYLAYTMTAVSLTELGEELDCDHTTILSSKNRVQARYEHPAERDYTREDVDAIRAILSGKERTCPNREAYQRKINRGTPIERLDEGGEVVAEYPSLTIASERTGIHVATLNGIIKGRHKTSKYGKWRYKAA